MAYSGFRLSVLVLLVAGLAVSGVAGAGPDNRGAFVLPPGSRLVEVIAHEYGFRMPDSIPAGLTTFLLKDEGKELHHLEIARLDDGRTIADVLAAFAKPGTPPPAWMHAVGGPNTPMPDGESNATLVLEPGRYVAFCIMPAPDGKLHIMHGMVRPFTVTPSNALPAPLPPADLAIALTDYDFKWSRPPTAGHHVIEVTNTGSQVHEMAITRFPPGLGNRDLEAWGYGPHDHPAPGIASGGVTAVPPGARLVIQVDFEPGRYGLVCFVPDANDGRPHFMHGMQTEFDVR